MAYSAFFFQDATHAIDRLQTGGKVAGAGLHESITDD
jgi:hypothetical protein